MPRRTLAAIVSIAAAIGIAGSVEAPVRAQQAGVIWQFETVAPMQFPAPGCRPGMALAGFEYDPQGRPVLGWREENNCGGGPDVFWTRKDGGAWHQNQFFSERRYDGTGKDGYYHTLILRPSDGNPFLVYRDVVPGNDLYTTRTDLGAYPNGGVSTLLEWLVGPQHAAYMDYSLAFAPGATVPEWATGLTEANGYGSMRLNGVEVGGGSRPHGALTITPDGVRHLLWNMDSILYYTRWVPGAPAPTTFPTPIFTTINRNGGEVKLMSDAAGVLHAVVRGIDGLSADWDKGAVVYMTSTDGGQTWSPLEYVDPNDAVPDSIGYNGDISMALDANSIPAVTYWRANMELWYARRDGPGGTWTRSLVTVGTKLGAPRSAQVRYDPAGQPVVALYDMGADRVVLARPVPFGSVPVDLGVTGSVTPANVQPGGLLTYTFTVTNHGSTNVDNIVVSNVLPAGVSAIDASPQPGPDGRWALGLVTSGGSASITVRATAPAASGDIVDVVSVTSDQTDADSSNNTAAIGATVCTACVVTVTQGLDVAASVTSAPNPVVVNGTITYVVKATNTGTLDAVGVTLKNTLPAGVTLLDAAPGPSNTSGGVQIFTFASVPAGGTVWAVIHAVAPASPGTVVDQVRVFVSGDANAANDVAEASTVVAADACFVAPSGLVSRWRGNGNTDDDIGGHDGVVDGSIAFAPGRIRDAFSFNGADGSVVMNDSPALRPAQFTVSAWVRPVSLRGGGWDVVLSTGSGIWLGFQGGYPKLYTHGFSIVTVASAPVPAGQWYHLTATFDGAAVRLYLNGAMIAQTATTAAMTYDANQPFAISGFWSGGRNQTYELFNGLIDEVTLHNRALNDAEVRGLYDGSSPSCPLPNRPPTLTNPGDQINAEGDSVTLPLTASDADGDTLTFSATGLPPGLSIDPATGQITGTTAAGSAGAYTPTVSVSDGRADVSQPFTWKVLAPPPPPSGNRAPVCSAAGPSVDVIWPPNHKLVVPVAINGVVDPDGDQLTVTITRILQDEPTNVTGDGNTPTDGFGVGTSTAQVRAERTGTPKIPGNGRVYEIQFRAVDPSGAACTGVVMTGVPHDQHKPIVDDVIRYDSTVAGGGRIR